MPGLWKMTAFAPIAALVTVLSTEGASDPALQRIQFEKGKTSATISTTLKVHQYPEAERHEYRLRAAAGQVLTIRLAATEPSASFGVACPGSGISGARGKAWSLTLPESGDYTIFVTGYGARASFPYTLEVGVEGKPRPVLPQGHTGTWRLVADPDSCIEIKEQGGKLRFAVHALYKPPNWKENGPNIGEIGATVDLRNGKAVFKDADADCNLAMIFTGDKLEVAQEGICGFGHNVRADGIYKRSSLCAAPEVFGDQ